MDDFEINWFANLVQRKLGRGDKIDFWNNTWIRDCSLKCKYPQWNQLSDILSCRTREFGKITIRNGKRIRVEFWQQMKVHQLMKCCRFCPIMHQTATLRTTSCEWLHYKLMLQELIYLYIVSELDGFFLGQLRKIGVCIVPPKVGVFGWRLVLGRLPTMVDLLQKVVLRDVHQQSCVFALRKLNFIIICFLLVTKLRKFGRLSLLGSIGILQIGRVIKHIFF